MNNHTRSCDHDNPQNAPEVVTTDTGKIRTGSSNGKIMVDTYYPMPVIDGADGAMLQLGYEKRRICGLKKRTFIIAAVVVAAVVIVAIAGGVAVGMKAGSNGNQDGKVADALPPPKVSNEPTNNVEKINSTMLLGSYLAATTGGDDKTYLTEARVFYQDVQNTIRTIHCRGLDICRLQLDSYNFTGAREYTPLAAVGNLEISEEIHVFYIDPDNRLQGKILHKDGSIEDDKKLYKLDYPDIHEDSQLAAVIYQSNGDIKLWYQQANTGTPNNPECKIQTLAYTKSGEWKLEDAVVNAKQGTSLSVITWDGGSSGDEKDRLIRLFYVSTKSLFAQYQYSSDAGWSIDKPDDNTVPKLVLNRNNPICSIVSRSEGRIRPRIEILTTSSPKKVVGTGADEDSGWYLNGDGNSGTSPRDPALLYEEGGPLAVVYYGVNNNETIYKLMHHGTTRKLYELVWDGMTLTTNEIDFHG